MKTIDLVLALLTLGLATLAWPTHAHATKICMKYPGDRYHDASPREFTMDDCDDDTDCDSVPGAVGAECNEFNNCEYDFGEDYGLSTSTRRARNILTQVFRSDDSLAWVGYATDGGCTGDFTPGAGPHRVRVYPVYQSVTTDVRFNVKDCSTGSGCTASYFDKTNVTLSGSSTNVTLPLERELDAYISAAHMIDRLAKNYYSTWQDFEIRIFTNTVTNWPPGTPFPRVYLTGVDTRSKFTLTHEVGHALYLEAIGLPVSQANEKDWVDCSNGPGGAHSHTLKSEEYASCAHYEGFGDYVSAAAWNNLGTNANGYYTNFTDFPDPSTFFVTDIESGQKEIHAHCQGSACCGLGTELDWARTFWDFRTDSGAKPANLAPTQVVGAAFPYPSDGSDNCSPGHYAAILSEVGFELGFTLLLKFNTKAIFNGADY